MAISSASAIVPEKMQFPRGTEVHNLTYQWFPDERDGFVYWLKGEFGAANAIIDSLCQHLRTTGEPDEYDMVFRSIQQRRCNWAPVLYMQQYFSISDVNLTLQQVAWRKQQRRFDQPKVNGKDFKKSNVGYRQVQKLDNRRENQNCSTRADAQKIEEESDLGEEIQRRASVQVPDENLSPEVSQKDGPCDDNAPKAAKFSAEAVTNQEGEDQDFPVPKFFVCDELFDGKMVNLLDGLKLYEGLFKVSEISSMISAVNEWRIAGRKGEFQGQTYVALRRPSKGHGREMIQFGVPVADGAPDDTNTSEGRPEPIPGVLRDIFRGLVRRRVATDEPDYCVINFFNEGDHSQPHTWQPWYGRPVLSLFMTECDVVSGRAISTDHRGSYRGPLELLLTPGSLLVMEGRSADQARHAISSSRRPRVVLVFGKSQPKEPPPFSVASRAASPRVSGPPTTIASHPWPSTCHQAFTAGGAFRAPAAHPHRLLSPSAAQPLVAPLATSGWAGAVPSGRPAAARLTVSGTGVFLPPGNAVASGAGRPVESPPPKENGSVGDTVEKLPSCGREQSLQLNGSWSGGPGSGERAEGEEQQTARVGERAY